MGEIDPIVFQIGPDVRQPVQRFKGSRPAARTTRKTTPEALASEFSKNKDKQDFSLHTIAENIVRRLEQEDRAVQYDRRRAHGSPLGDAAHPRRRRVGRATAQPAAQIAGLPTQLSCMQGRGLQWTAAALEQLSRLLNETLNACREEAASAEHMWTTPAAVR